MLRACTAARKAWSHGHRLPRLARHITSVTSPAQADKDDNRLPAVLWEPRAEFKDGKRRAFQRWRAVRRRIMRHATRRVFQPQTYAIIGTLQYWLLCCRCLCPFAVRTMFMYVFVGCWRGIGVSMSVVLGSGIAEGLMLAQHPLDSLLFAWQYGTSSAISSFIWTPCDAKLVCHSMGLDPADVLRQFDRSNPDVRDNVWLRFPVLLPPGDLFFATLLLFTPSPGRSNASNAQKLALCALDDVIVHAARAFGCADGVHWPCGAAIP